MEVVVTTWAISRAKLQSNHHHQQTNVQFFLQAGYPSCHPTNSVRALKGKYHIPWTCFPQAHLGVFQLFLWPLIVLLRVGLLCLSSALWCQYLSCSCVKRPNLRSLTTLFLDVPEITRYQGRTLLAHGNNFTRMLFLPPPINRSFYLLTHQWLLWVPVEDEARLAGYSSATLTTELRLLLEPRLLLFLCTVKSPGCLISLLTT